MMIVVIASLQERQVQLESLIIDISCQPFSDNFFIILLLKLIQRAERIFESEISSYFRSPIRQRHEA